MRPIKTRLSRRIVLALALLAPAAATAQHFPPDDDVRAMLRYLVEDGETPGIVLGMLEADGSTRIVSWGSGGPDARPVGPRSVFEIGSITKAFTGVLLADMVERGEVSLSDPVARYLPAGVRVPSRNGREITLLDLATHRSSLPRMPGNLTTDAANPYPPYTMEELYAFLAQHELRRDIGSEFEYSNMAVALLGEALARAAGRTYDDLVRERVLEPLGMRMTGTVVAGEMAEWNTQGHYQDGRVAPYRGWPGLPGMGALRSNAEDLLRFLAANTGPPASRLERVMRSAHEVRSSAGEGTEIGLNWLIRKAGDRTLIMHGGATAGYETQIAFDPARGVGVVLLTNTAEFDDDVALDLLRRGAGPARTEVAVSADHLRRYAGAYEVAPGRSLFVRLEDEGHLTVQMPRNVRFRMYADSDSTFFLKRTPWRLRFTRDGGGQVAGVVVDMEGTERSARRVGDAAPPPPVVAENAALDLPLTPEQMALYEGTYLLQAGERSQEMRVFVQDGQLMSQPGSQRPRRLLYQGNHQFRPDQALEYLLAFTLENGRAEVATLSQGERSMAGRRKP
ncbi:MAG TPA: serine hydrolase domain-containing protein [Longimicrobium sp.]